MRPRMLFSNGAVAFPAREGQQKTLVCRNCSRVSAGVLIQ